MSNVATGNGGATTALAKAAPAEVTEWTALKEQAKIALASRYLPRAIQTEQQAIAIALAGRELGLPVMVSLREIFLSEGKVGMSALAMHGLAIKRVPGVKIEIVKSSNDACVVRATRPGVAPTLFPFSMQDAQRAGLANKPNWRSYPAAMLRARCIAAACRAMCPDVLLGVYDPDELSDIQALPMASVPSIEATSAPELAAGIESSAEESVEGELLGGEEEPPPAPATLDAMALLDELGAVKDASELEIWGEARKPDVQALSDDERGAIKKAYVQKRAGFGVKPPPRAEQLAAKVNGRRKVPAATETVVEVSRERVPGEEG